MCEVCVRGPLSAPWGEDGADSYVRFELITGARFAPMLLRCLCAALASAGVPFAPTPFGFRKAKASRSYADEMAWVRAGPEPFMNATLGDKIADVDVQRLRLLRLRSQQPRQRTGGS